MKKYQTPCIEKAHISTEDIMTASDVLKFTESGKGGLIGWDDGFIN